MSNAKAHVKDFFSERARAWADGYTAIEPPTLNTRNLVSRQRFALEMLEACGPRASKVLDVGCGPGEVARELTRRGYEVWGVDIAEPMIRYARERCGSGRFQAGDLEYLPFRDNTFDAVMCLGVVEYLDTAERSLREIWRVLRPGGRAVISTASAISPLYHVDRILIRLTAAARPLTNFAKYRLRGRLAPVRQSSWTGFSHHRRFYPWRWGRLLRSVGLEPEDWVCQGWGWQYSQLGLLTELLSRKSELVRHMLERFIGQLAVRRATNKFVRNRALNWVLSEQIVRVRAVKVMLTPLSRTPGPPSESRASVPATPARYAAALEYLGATRTSDLTELELGRIRATIAMIPSDVRTVLDVGCGDGRVLRFVPPFYRALGVDYSTNSVRRLAENALCASSADLPFRERSFDLLLCCEVLEHLPKAMYVRTLHELERVACRHILVSVPYMENLRLQHIQCPECRAVFHAWGHVRRFSNRRLDTLFDTFRVTATHYVGPSAPRQNGLVLYINQRLGGRWAECGPTAMCPNCGNTTFPRATAPRNPVSIACGVINLVTSSVVPVSTKNWVLKLYSRAAER